MSKTYRNPPLKEAVFEVRFTDSSNYDESHVSEYAEEIKKFFPFRKDAARNEVAVQIDQKSGENQVKKTITKFETFFLRTKSIWSKQRKIACLFIG